MAILSSTLELERCFMNRQPKLVLMTLQFSPRPSQLYLDCMEKVLQLRVRQLELRFSERYLLFKDFTKIHFNGILTYN